MAGGLMWQIWLADAQQENVTGGLILQIWLALRAWGLRPSTPRSAGTRVLAVLKQVGGSAPTPPGPSADADVWQARAA
jgi:hypothetical protein